MSGSDPQLKRQPEYGYWYYDPPSAEVLREHYERRYFQENAIYASEYLPEEIEFFRRSADRKVELIRGHQSFGAGARCLEVGVGEGWSLAALERSGAQVLGIDYSLHGVSKWNPGLAPFMRVGPPETELRALLSSGDRFDLVWLDNVLEHVPSPGQTLALLQELIKPGGLLLAEVPNDQSELQAFLIDQNLVDRKYWLAYPEHLSYFSLDSLSALLDDKGFDRLDAIADFPIDLYLFNDAANYVMEKSTGKAAHRARMRFDRMVSGRGPEAAIAFYRDLAAHGLGRNMTVLFRRR